MSLQTPSQPESSQDPGDSGGPDGAGNLLPAARGSRNWLPLVLALVMVLAIVVAGSLVHGRSRPARTTTPVNAAADPYASQLPLSGVVMSESSNLAGGKVTYLDGQVANRGTSTVTGVTVQVLFRNAAGEVAQNETIPLTLIRMREPYVDTAAVSALPLKPGTSHDFRLIFDSVAADWAGSTPEIRVLKVESK